MGSKDKGRSKGNRRERLGVLGGLKAGERARV